MAQPRKAADDAGLARAADDNFVAAMELFGRTVTGAVVEQFGRVRAVSTGIPAAYFNVAFVVEAATTMADVHAATEWLDARRLPFVLHVRDDLDPALIASIDDLGLERRPVSLPSLVLDPIPEPPPPPAGLVIEAVEETGLAVHQAVLAEIFGMPPRVVRDLVSVSALGQAGFTVFTGWLDGRPVATSAALRTGDVVGVYNVGTIADVRRRGIGAALTWATVRAGVDAGCRSAILQSSAMGFSVYAAMGFRQVASYLEYVQRADRRRGTGR